MSESLKITSVETILVLQYATFFTLTGQNNTIKSQCNEGKQNSLTADILNINMMSL